MKSMVTQNALVEEIQIVPMSEDDYDDVHALWMTIRGFGIRALDDSREDIERFILRNPTTSVVAKARGRPFYPPESDHQCRREGGRPHYRIHPVRVGRAPGGAVSCLRCAGIPTPRDRHPYGRLLHA